MDAKKAGLILMFGMAYIDGKLDDSEKNKIAGYAVQNLDASDGDFEAITQLMIEASGEEMLKYVAVATAYIGAKVSTESKLKMLDFLIELVTADGKVHDNELSLITQLKDIWL